MVFLSKINDQFAFFIRAERVKNAPLRMFKKVLNPNINTLQKQHTPPLTAGYVDLLLKKFENSQMSLFTA